MSTISELIELLKEGSISKEQMLNRINSNAFPSKPRSPRFEQTADRETEVEFNTNDFEDFLPPTCRPFSVMNSESFVDRQAHWDAKRTTNQELLRKQKLKIEVKECTFKPKTNSKSPYFSQETFERLTQCKENLRLVKLKEEQERKKLEAEMENCTFQPQINRNSCLSGSKYLSDAPKKPSLEEPAFVPKIKGPGKGMNNVKKYLKQDPFERLSRPKDPQTEPEPKPLKSTTPVPEYSGCSFSTKPFFERQALYELMKFERKEASDIIPQPVPQINERSRKIAKKDFYTRNQEMIEKKKSPKPDPNPCSFQPKITDLAKAKKTRSCAEMSDGDLKKRQEKIDALKEAEEEKEKVKEQVECISVKSRSYASVKSKLQILEDPQSYIQRVKSEQRKKEIVSQVTKEERIKQELEACTYQPNIIDAPEYVKQIARNMAMIKSERVNYKLPSKPEWR